MRSPRKFSQVCKQYNKVMRTSNPTFNDKTFSVSGVRVGVGDAMTVNGTIMKTVILLLCALLTAGWTWNRFAEDPSEMGGYIAIGALGGFVVAFATAFKPSWSP